MGNKQSEQDSFFKGISSFQLQKISKSANTKTISFYIDENQFPESGLIAVGFEFVENYDKVKSKCYSFFKSPQKIISSSFISENKENSLPLLFLAIENKSVLVLNGKTLTVIKEIYPNILLEDYIIKSNASGFDKLFIDSLYCINEKELLIAFENGVVTRNLIIPEWELMQKNVYNPIFFQIQENNEIKEHIYENFILPSTSEILFSNKNQLVIVNHRNVFQNTFDRVFNLEDTPILLYTIEGEKFNKLVCKGSIFSACLLENRDIYIALTSENMLFFWNYLTGNLILRISLKMFSEKLGSELFFTKACVKEFPKDLKNKLFSEIFKDLDNDQKISGDYLFCGERAGNLLLSQIDFEENDEKKIGWSPLKILKSREENENQKTKILKSIQMASLNVYQIYYLESYDELYMVDNEAFVRIFKDIVKSSISQKKK